MTTPSAGRPVPPVLERPCPCACCDHKPPRSDTLQRARETLVEVMDGLGGRGAQARLSAAKTILEEGYLVHVPDEALLAEVQRRRERLARNAK